MKPARIIFPHQLFKNTESFDLNEAIFLVEEYLFFSQYSFHKQKLVFHRASMKHYADFLLKKGFNVNYIEASDPNHDIRRLLPDLKAKGFTHINYKDPTDNWLTKRILKYSHEFIFNIEPSLLFINSAAENHLFLKDKKRLLHHDFYVYQRKKLNILIDSDQKPIGGQWSFDAENRKKYPANAPVPVSQFPALNAYQTEAKLYVESLFPNNIGEISGPIVYPVTHSEAENWLQDFLEHRFHLFGAYEDAIVSDQHLLNHSLLSPLLNVGLLDINETVAAILSFAEKFSVPLNSTEGLIRQLIGWREYIRAIYEIHGTAERTRNFWSFIKDMPAEVYEANTGVLPLDTVLKKTYNTAYAHHIERLMVLGNYFVLSEIHPDAVYKWFMEAYIDAYDWVMVPNVYGMSQYADGGLMSTKPYISGSNYLLKMSNFKKGDWTQHWDKLFWRFLVKNRSFFAKNPRLNMLLSTYDKWPLERKEGLFIPNILMK